MHAKKVNRRQFLASSAAAGATVSAANLFSIGQAEAAGVGRVVILGFDGAEPRIAQELIAQGELPNLAKLQQQGAGGELGSTIPPQSPVAWSSFMTSRNPGGHNIFDFIRRDPTNERGPMPYVGTGKIEHPRLGVEGQLQTPADAITYRKGNTFWAVADSQGKRCKVLNVPFAFPADNLQHGVQLCSLGVPDLRGTTSTFFSLSDSFDPAQLRENLSGGKRLSLQFDANDTAQVVVPGPRDQRFTSSDPKGYTPATLELSVSRKDGVGMVTIGGNKVELIAGEWSPWIEIQFPMSQQFSAYSVTRFFPSAIGDQVRIYMACQQFHPDKPYVAFSSPEEYTKKLHERYGLYKTIGWAYDTHALRQGELHEDAFIKDVEETMAWREQLTLDEIDAGNFDLLISAWTATDRMGHMFWRFLDEKHPLYDPAGAKLYGKAIAHSYKIMDRIVGNVMARLKPDDLLIVMSDHGFESWRTEFDLNAWLQQEGYLAMSDPAKPFLMGVDWANTKAYSIGLSSLYLNIQGRESKGIVPQGEVDKLIAELKEKMLTITDPATGKKVYDNLYTRANFSGESLLEAPDISLGYSESYQSSKSCAKGAISEHFFAPNKNKWSGEHASSDMARLSGMFFCNRKIEEPKPHIKDLSVTTLAALGLDIPADYEGKRLL